MPRVTQEPTRHPARSAGAPARVRRDRRGRGRRGPLAWPPVPAMTTRSQAFDELVLDSAHRLERVLGRRHSDTEFAVEDVPPSDPAAWEDEAVVLGRVFPAEPGIPARVVVYRRPVEARAADAADLPVLVHEVVVQQVAALLGVSPEDVEDPG
ncbi:metallopeptidase family protein [Janibacter sp. G56]|uniref:metallopeptidase family protein n=1 Tax=Janibacter sp. G56 TaxID=3418717 RepID=UPI003D038639